MRFVHLHQKHINTIYHISCFHAMRGPSPECVFAFYHVMKKTYILFIICATRHSPRILYCFANCKTEPSAFSESSLCRNVIWEAPNIFMLHWLWIRVLGLVLPCFVYDIRRYNSYKMNTGMSGNSCCLWKKEGLLKKEEGVFQNIWWQNLISRQIFQNIFLYNHIILFCSLHSCSHSREW